MQRWLFVLGAAMAILALDGSLAQAADKGGEIWPDLGAIFTRGTGAYLSPWKIITSWLLFLAWVRTTDWISQDAQAVKLRYLLWNAITFFTFFIFFLVLWLLPWFAVGMIFLVIAWAAPLTTYIFYRNSRVPNSDKVLTQKHIRRWAVRKLNAMGVKVAGEEEDGRDAGPDIQLTAMGRDERDNNINLLTARQSLAWNPTRELLDETLAQRATHLMLDSSGEGVAVRYQIDGVWHDRAPLPRPDGEAILGVVKQLAAFDLNNRRTRQSGKFGMQAAKDKFTCKITAQPTQSGERALMQVEMAKVEFKSLDELGMRAKMQDQLFELLRQPAGLFTFCSLPAGGLTTTIDVVLSNMDRFTRSFVSINDATKPDRDIENVPATTFSSPAGETPATVLPKLVRTYPDVIILRELNDQPTLSILCEQVNDKRLVMVGMRAKEAVEALLRLLALKVPAAEVAPVVNGVLNMRLVRKLCEKCKEAYPPSPEVLKQLGLPAGRVESLYRPPTEPIDPKHPDVVCDQCLGIGYFGRTAIFELLTIDDDLRQALATTPKLEILRAKARKSKHRSLQEEGVLLVARGVTSLPELLRVLKQ